jgi:hypothetical protein
MSRILEFYREQGRDHRGRELAYYQRATAEQWERSHDMVQWAFPLTEKSRHFLQAPTLTAKEIEAFRGDPSLQERVDGMVCRYLNSLGLSAVDYHVYCDDADCPGDHQVYAVYEDENWDFRRPVWLTPRNHNFLRLTRVLKCLKLFGKDALADGLFDYLSTLAERPEGKVIGTVTLKFWSDAAEGANT